MKKYTVVLLLSLCMSLCALNVAYAQPERRMSVLTCSPGSEMYAAFGHTGLRVVTYTGAGAVTGADAGAVVTDVVYNFGLFDFDTPNFYSKFIRGELDYFLGVERTDHFLVRYGEEGRGVVEQTLGITPAQADSIMQRLEWLLLPQHRAYRYKFFRDNCTTEVRDLLLEFCDVASYDVNAPSGHTFRDYLNGCMAARPWLRYGVNILLGSDADSGMTMRESMFLPEMFMRELNGMGNGDVKLVSAEALISGSGMPVWGARTMWREAVPFGVALLLLLLALWCRSRYPAFAVLLVAGLVGCLLAFVSLYSRHAELSANYNLLWCSPVCLIAAFGVLMRRRLLVRVAAVISVIALAAMVPVSLLGVQSFPLLFWVLACVLVICQLLQCRSTGSRKDPLSDWLRTNR